jgi:hypothetical protein
MEKEWLDQPLPCFVGDWLVFSNRLAEPQREDGFMLKAKAR